MLRWLAVAALVLGAALLLAGCCLDPCDPLCPGDPCAPATGPCDPCSNGGCSRFWTPVTGKRCCWWRRVPAACDLEAPLPDPCDPVPSRRGP